MLAAYRAGGLERRTPPARVLSISLLALLVAGLASLVFPSSLDQYAGLVWVLALVPVSLLAYYRGWRGAALATVGAMVVYILIQVVVIRLMGREVDWRLFGAVTVVLIAVTFAVGGRHRAPPPRAAAGAPPGPPGPLTGLANRRLLRLEVDRAMSLADRQESRAAMIYVDLGRFKRVNDTYGHRAGDEVLAQVAERVRRSVRACDTVARVGGDEFAVLLLDVRTIGDSHAAARRIGRCFQERVPGGRRRGRTHGASGRGRVSRITPAPSTSSSRTPTTPCTGWRPGRTRRSPSSTPPRRSGTWAWSRWVTSSSAGRCGRTCSTWRSRRSTG